MGRFMVTLEQDGKKDRRLIDVEGTTAVTSGVMNAANQVAQNVESLSGSGSPVTILSVAQNDMSPLDG